MPPKKQPTTRELMERAIDVMRQSVAEPRSDGKASPRVGVVLVKPDGTIETAYRGETHRAVRFRTFDAVQGDPDINSAKFSAGMAR